jgi:hypothetical protein
MVSMAFGAYALSMGVLLLAVPGTLMALLRLPPIDTPWLGVVAAMALALGLYYVEGGRHELVPFFRASVAGRLAFAVITAGVAFAWDAPAFYLFAAVDAGSALLTAWLLSRGR